MQLVSIASVATTLRKEVLPLALSVKQVAPDSPHFLTLMSEVGPFLEEAQFSVRSAFAVNHTELVTRYVTKLSECGLSLNTHRPYNVLIPRPLADALASKEGISSFPLF